MTGIVAATGNARVDTFITEVVHAFEEALPGAVRGYYVIGSYADGSAVAISDLDLVVLFRRRMEKATRAAAWRVGDALERRCPVRLDLTISGEDDSTWEKAHLKRASRLVYGEDVRDRLALRNRRPARPPVSDREPGLSRAAMRYAARTLRELRGVPRLRFPLEFPDASGEFFGYDVIRHPEWYPAGVTRGLRELVNAVTLMAGALTPTSPEGGAATRSEAVTLYRERVGGAWPEFVDAIYRNAKLRWGYLVPNSAGERAELRALCEQMLGFENHFLQQRRAELLRLLPPHGL